MSINDGMSVCPLFSANVYNSCQGENIVRTRRVTLSYVKSNEAAHLHP